MNKKKQVIIFIALFILIIIGVIRNYASRKTIEIPGVITSEEQLYNVLVDSIENYKSKIIINTPLRINEFDFDRIIAEVFEENPIAAGLCVSFSYGYRMNKKDSSLRILEIHFIDPSPAKARKLKKRVKKIANCVRDLPDDYSKIKAVHDYIVLSNVYIKDQYGAYSALYNGYSSCTGYALGFYLIMEELGIPVTYETGGMHAWNRVYLDGEWYNIDLTWDDAGDHARYDFFLKCDADFADHAHGGATARTSMDVHGPSDKEYFSMFPNYKFLKLLIPIGVAIAGLSWIRISTSYKFRRWVKKIRGYDN